VIIKEGCRVLLVNSDAATVMASSAWPPQPASSPIAVLRG